MKTKGLRFAEAIEALAEYKCERIKSSWSGAEYANVNGTLYPCDRGLVESLFFKEVLGAWELIETDPPRTEERFFVYWIVVWDDGDTPTVFTTKPSEQTAGEKQQVFKCVKHYTYTYPSGERNE